MILCDTGALICVIDRSQALHKSYVRAFEHLNIPIKKVPWLGAESKYPT